MPNRIKQLSKLIRAGVKYANPPLARWAKAQRQMNKFASTRPEKPSPTFTRPEKPSPTFPTVRSAPTGILTAPVAVSQAFRTTQSGKSLVFRAAEEYSALTWSPAGSASVNASAGGVLYIPLNPALWRGTRVADALTSYAGWRLTKATIMYRPSLGTGWGGYVSAVSVPSESTFSAADDPVSTDTSMSSLPGYQTGVVYTPFAHKCALDGSRNSLTEPLHSLSFAMVSITSLSTTGTMPTSPTDVGKVFIDYEVVMDTPVAPWALYTGTYFVNVAVGTANVYTVNVAATSSVSPSIDDYGVYGGQPWRLMCTSCPYRNTYGFESKDPTAPAMWPNNFRYFRGQRLSCMYSRSVTPAFTGGGGISCKQAKIADMSGLDISSTLSTYYDTFSPQTSYEGQWLIFEAIGIVIVPAGRVLAPLGTATASLALAQDIRDAEAANRVPLTVTSTDEPSNATTTTTPTLLTAPASVETRKLLKLDPSLPPIRK